MAKKMAGVSLKSEEEALYTNNGKSKQWCAHEDRNHSWHTDGESNKDGKLQEIKDVQTRKSISVGKAMNQVEGLETQTWFGKMQLMLSIMVKLPLSMSKRFMSGNDGIPTPSLLLRQDVVKRRKRWKNDDN
uniref:Uncharacterized protein n=1 Tax=Populus trichocarpa TaxID=3694 RepID=B9NK69_POPTR